MSQISLNTEELSHKLNSYLSQILELLPEDASETNNHLIRAEQSGKVDHGLIRFKYIADSGKFGPFGFKSSPHPEKVTETYFQVNGKNNLGYPIMKNIVDTGCEVCERDGLCVISGDSVYPSGAIGDWARLACSKRSAVIIVSSSPHRVAPIGAKKPVVGTNPICIGIPSAPEFFISDSSMSAITHGQLLLSQLTGDALPENSAINSCGKPTTDSSQVFPTKGLGALLPFGGSHKSFALAMAVELLTKIGKSSDLAQISNSTGVFCVFIGPKILESGMPLINDWLNKQKNDGIRIPGWESGKSLKKFSEKGIVEFSKQTYLEINRLINLKK